MAYLKINNIDFSQYVNALKVNTENNYNAQTNAAGDTVVDYINSKRTLEVGIIPVDSEAMVNLQDIINNFNVLVEYRDPRTGALNQMNCIIPDNEVEYYTIQANKVLYNAFNIELVEL